jgi:hypothetical protein
MRVKRLGITVLAGCILLFGALNVLLVLQVHVEADVKDWPLSSLHALYFTSARSLLPFAESNSFLISPGASTSEEQERAGLTEEDEEGDVGEEPLQEPLQELSEEELQSDLEEEENLQELQVEGDQEGEPEAAGEEEPEGGGEVELEAAPAEPEELRVAVGGAGTCCPSRRPYMWNGWVSADGSFSSLYSSSTGNSREGSSARAADQQDEG